jgi:type IV fimbrial biogenesis protein FimT
MTKTNWSNTSHNSQKGITLIELMITITVLAILSAVAVPSMKNLFERKTVFAMGGLFVKSIKLARLEAIQRGRTVTVLTQSGTGDWSQGWLIQFTNDAGAVEVIKNFPALQGDPIFTSGVFNGIVDLNILATGQVATVGNFTMFYNDCVGRQILNYNILLSGLMQKTVTVCP